MPDTPDPFSRDYEGLGRCPANHESRRPTRVGDKDTLFPIQAAVGYSIAQTLFLGKRSVIIEGITDYWLLKGLNDALCGIGGYTTLADETILIPTGGTSRLMPLASIMFAVSGVGQRRLLVLLDSDKEGRQAAQRVTDAFGDESRAGTFPQLATAQSSWMSPLRRAPFWASFSARLQPM